MNFEKVTRMELVRRYCETQEMAPLDLLDIIERQIVEFGPDGFFLARASLMDSSYFGSRVMLPYGPNNTFKTPPDHPFTPRGLASDTSVVECVWVLDKAPVVADVG